MLLRYGAKLDASAGQLEAALKLAVEEVHMELASMVLLAGAKVNTELALYGSFLQLAPTKGDGQLVSLLIRHGATVNSFGPTERMRGNCPLMAATSCGKTIVVRLLLSHGALIDRSDGVFGNLLQTASHLGYFDVVKTIFEQKVEHRR